MEDGKSRFRFRERVSLSALAVLIMAAGVPAVARAQQLHGAVIRKACAPSPVRTCTDAASCNDNNDCTSDECNTSLPNKTNCTIAVTNLDDFGDTIRINTANDVISAATPPTGVIIPQ